MRDAKNVHQLGVILESLNEQGFKGELRINYGKDGPKHCHVHLYIDLEEISLETLMKKYELLGELKRSESTT